MCVCGRSAGGGPADGLCLLLPAVPPVGNEAAGPRMLPYAVRLAQRALEQADYGLWLLQGRLFQLIN